MNRRRFLGTAGATAAASLAGCLGVLEGGSGGSYDTVTKYTYSKDDAESGQRNFSALQRSPSTVLELDEHVSMDLQAQLDQSTSYAWGDVDPATLDHEIEIMPGGDGETPYYRVFLGSFDLGAARDRLAESSEGTSTYEGFDVYAGVTGSTSSSSQQAKVAVAVGEGAVVQSGGVLGNSGSVDQLHRVADAAVGSADPITAANDDLAAVAGRIQPGISSILEPRNPDQQTNVEQGRFAGVTAGGSYGTVDGDTVNTSVLLVFESDDAASAAPVGEYVSQARSSGRLDSATHSVDGHVVEIEGSASAATMLGV